MNLLSTCQPGYEAYLARELSASGGSLEQGPGWVHAATLAAGSAGSPAPTAQAGPLPAWPDLAFAHLMLAEPKAFAGDSVNELAQAIFRWFGETLRGERIESDWPLIWQAAGSAAGLSRRAASVEAAFTALLERQLARVAKLARPQLPKTVGPARGLFVLFTDFGRALAARVAWVNGPRRMADDPAAPSRSYLKLEEAYILLGREPAPNESVVDLGAAPGGWSYSAARRGARVLAIDNGPLKGGALDHPNIRRLAQDAFRYEPSAGERCDWLLCDLVEEPHHVLESIVAPWLEHRWCRRFVVNLKFGRVDPIAFLGELRAAASPLARASGVRIRHLFHDREEFTVAGTLP